MKKAMTVFLLSGILCGWNHAGEYYVSPEGNDRNPGTKEKPFASVHRVQEVVRADAKRGSEEIIVWIKEGAYFLDQPLMFGPKDGGTEKAGVTYAGMPGEKVILHGAKRLGGEWKVYRDGIWMCSVRGKEFENGFTQLFVNGHRQMRARTPNEGLFKLAGEENEEEFQAFRYQPGDIRKDWRNLKDVEIVFHQHWTEGRIQIQDVDKAAGVVNLAGRTWRPTTWCKGYYVENILEGLDQTGEWYFDRAGGVLYYKPAEGVDLKQAEILIPVRKGLIRIEGRAEEPMQYLTLKALNVWYSDWELGPGGYNYPQSEVPWPWEEVDGVKTTDLAKQPIFSAVYAMHAGNITIEGCDISHTGGFGIDLSDGCQGIVVKGNRFTDLGAGAVKVGEPENPKNLAEETGGNTLCDNFILDGCKVYLAATGVWIGQSGHNRVIHNEITGAFQWAISAGWHWDYTPNPARENIIECNDCHGLGNSLLGSHAVIYSLGISPGTVIRNNYVHDIGGDGYGIALDESSAGIVIENNVVFRTGRGLHFNRGCVGNIVQNNIFALTRQSQTVRYADRPGPGTVSANITIRNIYYWKEGKLFHDKYEWPNFDDVRDYNVYWQAGGEPVRFLTFSLDEWKAKFLDVHSVIADPKFIDVEKGNLCLAADSPAIKLGFKPIDLKSVGPRK